MDRSQLISKAASLPQGNEERRTILSKLAARPQYRGDPNVSLGAVVWKAQEVFAEDVAKAVIRYSSLKTPVKNLSGYTYTRKGIAYGTIVNRTVEPEGGLSVEVQASRGKIKVILSDVDGDNDQAFRFPDHGTPAAIGSDLSHVGETYLMPR